MRNLDLQLKQSRNDKRTMGVGVQRPEQVAASGNWNSICPEVPGWIYGHHAFGGRKFIPQMGTVGRMRNWNRRNRFGKAGVG